MTAAEFRKQWSHKPTPIPQDATGLWYSEECAEQLMSAFAASERQAVIKECAKKLDSMAAKANEIGNKIFETQWIRDCNIAKASTLTEAARAIRSME